ncbi:Uncharacterised protein [Moraxella lacunata]|uniref:Uncharacterized protein n=1 Tax=Moraxella lacunata TaxID=477 RepID=A0A378T6E5_MORLA|nr:hypothetical protein [Moraxella lacunata]STZ56401.1 Uncharacterised protein [Moraxella lacunata]
MTVIEELNNLLHFNKKLSKKIEKLFQTNFTYQEYMKIKEHIQYQGKYLKPKYDYEDFEREREMIRCILYSTIGQESMDWVKEWSDIPYEIFTGTEPNSYGYDQVKLFVENYYELMKETGRLKMFINEDYYLNKWREKHKDKKDEIQQKLKYYQALVEDCQEALRRLE